MLIKRYKGCDIYLENGGYTWEEPVYGQESDDAYRTIAECEADIDVVFPEGTGLRVVDNEVTHCDEEF